MRGPMNSFDETLASEEASPRLLNEPPDNRRRTLPFSTAEPLNLGSGHAVEEAVRPNAYFVDVGMTGSRVTGSRRVPGQRSNLADAQNWDLISSQTFLTREDPRPNVGSAAHAVEEATSLMPSSLTPGDSLASAFDTVSTFRSGPPNGGSERFRSSAFPGSQATDRLAPGDANMISGFFGRRDDDASSASESSEEAASHNSEAEKASASSSVLCAPAAPDAFNSSALAGSTGIHALAPPPANPWSALTPFHRTHGDQTRWLPGTGRGGMVTQTLVEQLAAESSSLSSDAESSDCASDARVDRSQSDIRISWYGVGWTPPFHSSIAIGQWTWHWGAPGKWTCRHQRAHPAFSFACETSTSECATPAEMQSWVDRQENQRYHVLNNNCNRLCLRAMERFRIPSTLYQRVLAQPLQAVCVAFLACALLVIAALAVGEVSRRTGIRPWAAAWGRSSQQDANSEALSVCSQMGVKCRLLYTPAIDRSKAAAIISWNDLDDVKMMRRLAARMES